MNNNGNAAYTKSNEITSVSLNRFRKTEYNKLLSDKNRQKDAQTLMDYLCGKFNIPKVRVIVTNTPQPHSTGFDTEDGIENEKEEYPEVIIYRGNQIHKFGEDRYVAYVMDRYGDIDDYAKSTLEEAQEVIDKHIGNYNL